MRPTALLGQVLVCTCLLITPGLTAQIDANGGFVSAPAPQIPSQQEPDGSSRPVRVQPPRPGKVVPHGNLMIVHFEEPGLAHYMGDIPGLAATSPRARGEKKLDSQSPASREYLEFLSERQKSYVSAFEEVLSRNVEVVFHYKAAVNGIAVKMSRAEGKLIEKIPGVLRVVPDRLEYLDTDRGPLWIGADNIWDGTATGGLPGTMGEGIVVGVIDTGINMDHPSFAEVGGDGYAHTNPNGSGNFVGWCNPAHPDYDASYVCNDKLIGAWDYTDAYCAANPRDCTEADGPEDAAGHGSHTSSTAAGNVLLSPAISGVAPHANIIMYDACYDPSCPFSATSAAADQALLDGVDVINYSIGGGTSPWGGDIDTYFLENTENGTFVSASAGNSGPGAATVAHLGPWLITVGNGTHDRGINTSTLTDLAGGAPPADLDGSSSTEGFGPATIVHASTGGDAQCLDPFAPGTWTGEIVVCDRGGIARVLKCAHVAAGGAGGCVLANVTDAVDPAPVISPDPHVIPAIHVNTANGDALRAWLATLGVKTARITDYVEVNDPAAADIMAVLSSRGPNNQFDILKPDVTNPGSDILAAVQSGDPLFPPPEFAWYSGTSMSSPHTAGSGALLKALHPGWSPLEVKSALMMTADTTVKKEDGTTDADPWDMGAGRVDLTKAGLAGLVLDETYENFVAADPALGGSPELLNIASLKQSQCVISCSWERTFTSPVTTPRPEGVGVSWTVSSTSPDGVTVTADPFQVEAGNDVTVEFTASAAGTNPGDPPVFASAVLTPNDGSPVLHLPVVLAVTDNNFPSEIEITTTEEVGSSDVEDLQTSEGITDLTVVNYGLAQANETEVSLNEDPTNGNPYDNLGQVYFKTVNVPAGTLRLISATESDESPDVDLYMGTGNTPSAVTEECVSGSPAATEFCEVENPSPGTWWILVQNWEGSMDQPDLIRLLDGAVPDSDEGNMAVTGPAAVPAGQPFSVNVAWDLSTMMAAPDALPASQFWFGAYSLAKDDVSNPIGTTFVVLELAPDFVFYDDFEDGSTDSWTDTMP